MPSIDDTKRWVEEIFAGVLDKGGKPYAGHCIRVMEGLGSDASDDAKHAALLHDVLEDTTVTMLDIVQRGYSERTCELVFSLTRPTGVYYMDYIRAIANASDPELITIKLADNADNSDPERIAALPEHERSIAKRYQRARDILEAAV